ncbi:YaiI/YqxD family protein [Raoultibacter phocaeensis]|uniref:YaiI/YqxD family protein n=1 Tax=Raoultibacter phocaeensis TaxID=2479841 RepID=UPI0021044037|nr:YaiI/YqxD family protein [Raoultibacter phocaeensis]
MPHSEHKQGIRPTIIIDADACPVTAEALAVARKRGLPVLIAGNSTQNLARHIRRGDPRKDTGGFWADTLAVGVGADSADFAIVERLQPGDIVVTQDIGLAAMVLGRSAHAIGVRGRVYTRATIDMDMEIRHQEKKIRRQGGRTKGPAAFTDEDRERFAANLDRLVEESVRCRGPRG